MSPTTDVARPSCPDSRRTLRRRRELGARLPLQSGFTALEVVLSLLVVGILVQIAIASYQNYRDRMDIARATLDVGALGAEISQYAVDRHGLPNSLADIGRDGFLDPWGHPYQYLSHDTSKGNGLLRKDKNIVPINSDFDLYSMGKDGQSSSPLTASISRDDIVRANDGRFVGLASVYDP